MKMEYNEKAKILLEYGSMAAYIREKLLKADVDDAEIEERISTFFFDFIDPKDIRESYDAEELSGDPEEATYETWHDAWEDNHDSFAQRLAEEYSLMIFNSDKDMEEELLMYIMKLAAGISVDGGPNA